MELRAGRGRAPSERRRPAGVPRAAAPGPGALAHPAGDELPGRGPRGGASASAGSERGRAGGPRPRRRRRGAARAEPGAGRPSRRRALPAPDGDAPLQELGRDALSVFLFVGLTPDETRALVKELELQVPGFRTDALSDVQRCDVLADEIRARPEVRARAVALLRKAFGRLPLPATPLDARAADDLLAIGELGARPHPGAVERAGRSRIRPVRGLAVPVLEQLAQDYYGPPPEGSRAARSRPAERRRRRGAGAGPRRRSWRRMLARAEERAESAPAQGRGAAREAAGVAPRGAGPRGAGGGRGGPGAGGGRGGAGRAGARRGVPWRRPRPPTRRPRRSGRGRRRGSWRGKVAALEARLERQAAREAALGRSLEEAEARARSGPQPRPAAAARLEAAGGRAGGGPGHLAPAGLHARVLRLARGLGPAHPACRLQAGQPARAGSPPPEPARAPAGGVARATTGCGWRPTCGCSTGAASGRTRSRSCRSSTGRTSIATCRQAKTR